MDKVIVVVAALACSGCGVLPVPNQVSACVDHVSHPLSGKPFGPKEEEDSLNTVGTCTRWERGPVEVDVGLGYMYTDGGFYGDDFIFSSRVSVKLWEK